MSIRRITDLPFLERADIDLDNFNNSYLEVSYLSGTEDDNGQEARRYVSNGLRCGDFVDIISSQMETGNYFPHSIYIENDLNLSGNVYVNKGIGTAASQYEADLNFGKISLKSVSSGALGHDGSISLTGSKVDIAGGGAKISLVDNTLSIKNHATVDTTQSIDNSVVNVRYLNQKLAELSGQILAAAHGELTVVYDYNISLPFLSFVYLDHKLGTNDSANDSWKIAGSEVDLSKYQPLKDWIDSNWSNLKSTTSNDNDTWKYSKNGNTLILPTTNWFIQGQTNMTDSGKGGEFVEAGLPSHTHTVTFCNIAPAGNGGLSRTATFPSSSYAKSTSGASNAIYGKSTTVQPNANKMYIYFYVGPKTS